MCVERKEERERIEWARERGQKGSEEREKEKGGRMYVLCERVPTCVFVL